jgi:hypothetical protein
MRRSLEKRNKPLQLHRTLPDSMEVKEIKTVIKTTRAPDYLGLEYEKHSSSVPHDVPTLLRTMQVNLLPHMLYTESALNAK